MEADGNGTVSLVLASGTDDRLTGSAVLVVGAAAMGRPVEILLQYWALDAFRADRITKDHGLSPEAGEEGRARWEQHRASIGANCSGRPRRSGTSRSRVLALDGPARHHRAGPRPLGGRRCGVAAFLGSAQGPITYV